MTDFEQCSSIGVLTSYPGVVAGTAKVFPSRNVMLTDDEYPTLYDVPHNNSPDFHQDPFGMLNILLRGQLHRFYLDRVVNS